MNWLRRLFCRHPNLRFHRKAFLVEEWPQYKRSWYWCPDCHRIVKRKEAA